MPDRIHGFAEMLSKASARLFMLKLLSLLKQIKILLTSVPMVRPRAASRMNSQTLSRTVYRS